jgi:PAS domain S-box-containing protein
MAARETLIERELKEAREREADYRTRLARHRDLARRLRLHATALREALRRAAGSANLTDLLAEVARLSGQGLGVARTGIWLFDEQRKHLISRLQLSGGTTLAGDGRLVVADCPLYFAALAATDLGAVAVNDAIHDPRTSQLGDYLRRHGVGATMDIPIQGPGLLHGVVRHEHLGGPRAWHEDEIEFAAQVGALVAVALEAERRVQAERAASWTEAKYQHLIESLPVVVYSFQASTRQLEYLSPGSRELSGRDPQIYLTAGGMKHWLEAIEPAYREPVLKRLAGTVAEGLTPELVYPIRLPDGRRRWIRDNCAVVRDVRGRPFAIQGTLADISALKEAEQAREELERRYRTLLENIDLLALILGATGRVEFVNDCFVRLTGYTRDEALGADGFDLMLAEGERDKVRGDFLKSIRKGQLVPRFESNVRTRDGRNRRILWTNTLLRSSTGEIAGSSSLGVDITERLEAEATQLESHKLESLGRLAAGMAHDFNNLLSVIAGAASVLEGAAAQGQAREEIEVAIQQAADLTRSLLAYARREPIAPSLLCVDELVPTVLPLLETLAGSQISLSTDLRVPEARVVIDATQLRQVLINLVGNAVDATRGYGSHVRVGTNVVVLETDQARARGLIAEGFFLILTVADDGRGMTRDLAERAFDPFFTTKRGVEREAGTEGTGLGLAMCASIVQRAGGFISVDTAPGQGAAFHVHLPVAALQPKRGEPKTAPPLSNQAADVERAVLVVEDLEPVRNLVTRVLSARGMLVREAPDLATARRLLAESPAQVLMTDGLLPDGSGIDFAQEARARGLVRRVILMSGASTASPGGAIDALVAKPFRPESLVETVLRLLDQR